LCETAVRRMIGAWRT